MAGKVLVTTVTILLLSSCVRFGTRGPVTLRSTSVAPQEGPIVVRSFDLSKHRSEMLAWAVATINDEVFEGCAGLTLTSEEGAPGNILVIDDPEDASARVNSCNQPYTAVTKDGVAVVNTCRRYMGWGWPHAVHPDAYMYAHLLGEALGLPNSTAHPLGWASYSANDASVRAPGVDPRTGQPRTLLFRFGDQEKKALRARYCK